MRRALVLVHLWLGLAAGLYVCLVCINGAALVFRLDLQRSLHPHLFTATTPGPPADPATIMDAVARAYPGQHLAGVDAPSSGRPTYLAYVTRGDEFLTLLLDPVTGAVLGALPQRTWVRTLQRLHFDLLAGRTGRTVNGVGACVLFVLCATGLAIGWPGARSWWRGLVVDPRRSGRRVVWELHRAAGAWSALFLLMWAITGLAYTFPQGFRSVVSQVSPITAARAPTVPAAPTASRPLSWRTLVANARLGRDGQFVARVVAPATGRGALLVMFADRQPTPVGAELASVYVDPFTGRVLSAPPSARTLGDRVLAWVTPLHVGGVGGRAGQVVWALVALVPSLLLATGAISWWLRVRRQAVR